MTYRVEAEGLLRLTCHVEATTEGEAQRAAVAELRAHGELADYRAIAEREEEKE